MKIKLMEGTDSRTLPANVLVLTTKDHDRHMTVHKGQAWVAITPTSMTAEEMIAAALGFKELSETLMECVTSACSEKCTCFEEMVECGIEPECDCEEMLDAVQAHLEDMEGADDLTELMMDVGVCMADLLDLLESEEYIDV